ncbi:hypothetical protein TRFO_28985 [Tritrichomonas foetus]|uniref:Pecanex C-terminal domain-containing protein n=1 Tax=Tritrichomonas foetus TaxID=1144522 RepID=A0A1J4JX92_9EUKA|nr:hypothetical protein TRFO_28985 [Tritrichomonas foetus]|eukprot:OHT03611.1 hypothetical protein TRFO_28985 [Tritrichomonas foetus]
MILVERLSFWANNSMAMKFNLESSSLRALSKIIRFIIFSILFLIFAIPFFLLDTPTGYAIFSGCISFCLALFYVFRCIFPRIKKKTQIDSASAEESRYADHSLYNIERASTSNLYQRDLSYSDENESNLENIENNHGNTATITENTSGNIGNNGNQHNPNNQTYNQQNNDQQNINDPNNNNQNNNDQNNNDNPNNNDSNNDNSDQNDNDNDQNNDNPNNNDSNNNNNDSNNNNSDQNDNDNDQNIENGQNNENDRNENENENENNNATNNNENENENHAESNVDTGPITENPLLIPNDLWNYRFLLFPHGELSENAVYTMIQNGWNADDVFALIQYCLNNPRALEGNPPNKNSTKEKITFKQIFHHFFSNEISLVYIIINVILSFLSTFMMIYVMHDYPSLPENSLSDSVQDGNKSLKDFFRVCSMLILTYAHMTMIFPIKAEIYSITFDEQENSMTRCFSVFLLSTGLFFFHKYEEMYFGFDYLRYIFFIFLIFMAFDITIQWGFIGLPRTTIHWFLEFVNRYLFGYSGNTTFLNTIFQFFRGAVVSAIVCLTLWKQSNYIFLTVSFFLASFLCKVELNSSICLNTLIQSFLSAIVFILFNLFCQDYCNHIQIIGIVYYFIFEYLIPYFSSINPYLFLHVQITKYNKYITLFRIFAPYIIIPAIVGSVIHTNMIVNYKYEHFVVWGFLIIHTINRAFSEPFVFGLALVISRFVIYHDLNYHSSFSLNFLISLLVSRKLFSIFPFLYFRIHIRLSNFNVSTVLIENFKSIGKTLIMYSRLILPSFLSFNIFPAIIWSSITGAPMNCFKLIYHLAQPSPPRSNSFWDHPSERKNIDEHPLESSTYFSYLGELEKRLAFLIKSGQLGIVDENSFFIFVDDDYVMIIHIISIDFWSISYQIRCSEFINTTPCHVGELNFLKGIAENNFYHEPHLQTFPLIFQSIWSPVAQGIELKGLHHYTVNLNDAFVSLEEEQKDSWLTYALCYFYSKNAKEFEIPEKIESKTKLDENILSQFEFENPEIVSHFLAKIYKEIKRNINYPFYFFSPKPVQPPPPNQNRNHNHNPDLPDTVQQPNNENTETEVREQQDPNNETNNDTNNDTNNENNTENVNENETAPENNDNPLLNNINNRVFNRTISNENFDDDPNVIKDEKTGSFYKFTDKFPENLRNVEIGSLIYETARRTILYWSLAASYLSPELDEIGELRDFLDQTETEYSVVESNPRKWIEAIENRKNDVFSLLRKEENILILYIRQIESKWTVFKLKREYVRSIWATECHEVVGLNNNDSERTAMQKNVTHLHNLIIQTSDLPMEYPAYVSDIQQSVFSFS